MDRFIDDNKIILIMLGLMFTAVLVEYGSKDTGLQILSNIVSGLTGALSMRSNK